jgi:hypothetical protein
MKTAYLVLGTAIALSAAALAGSGPPARGPDGSVDTTHNAHPDAAAETGRTDDGMAQGDDSGRVTTTVRNGGNLASVTQSGNPETVVKRIEKRPGYTRLEQRSGNSSAVIVQSNNVADLPLDKIPPAFREFSRR